MTLAWWERVAAEVTPTPTPTPTVTPVPVETVVPVPVPVDTVDWSVLATQLDTLTWAFVAFGVLALILLGIMTVKALS